MGPARHLRFADVDRPKEHAQLHALDTTVTLEYCTVHEGVGCANIYKRPFWSTVTGGGGFAKASRRTLALSNPTTETADCIPAVVHDIDITRAVQPRTLHSIPHTGQQMTDERLPTHVRTRRSSRVGGGTVCRPPVRTNAYIAVAVESNRVSGGVSPTPLSLPHRRHPQWSGSRKNTWGRLSGPWNAGAPESSLLSECRFLGSWRGKSLCGRQCQR